MMFYRPLPFEAKAIPFWHLITFITSWRHKFLIMLVPQPLLFSKSKWYFPLSGIWQNRGNLQIGTSKSFNKNYHHAQRPDVLHTRVAFLHPFIHEQVDILTLLSAITHTNALNFSSVVAPTWSALGVMCPWEQTIPTK